MQLIIAAVGHKMPAWIETGFNEYAKRMPPECRLHLKEIKPVERSASKTAEIVMAQERSRIEAVFPKGGRVIALDGAYMLGFGPRAAHARRDLARLLHRDADLPALPARSWT